MTLTKENLIAQAEGNITMLRASLEYVKDPFERDDISTDLRLAEIALAALTAEPVAYIDPFSLQNFATYRAGETDNKRMGREWMWANPDSGLVPVYTAPPAPASVPDEAYSDDCPDLYPSQPDAWAAGWNACCAAMLQGAEPVTTACKLPMQPLSIDAHGTLRFKENPIVRKLLDYATEHGYGLNEIALDEFEAEYQMQLAQLIGYSLSGYGTLSYVTDESYDRAAAAAPQQEANNV